MTRNTYLLRKRGRFYFRRRVPSAIALATGYREIVRILPPCTAHDARAIARGAAAELDKFFSRSMKQENITKAKLDEVVRAIFDDMLTEFERGRPRFDDPDDWADYVEYARRRVDGAAEMIKNNFWRDAEGTLSQALAEHDLVADRRSPEFKDAARATLRAFLQASKVEVERLQGNYAAVSDDPLFTERPAAPTYRDETEKHSILLSEAYAMLRTDRVSNNDWRADMIRESQNTHDLMLECFGDCPINEIDRKDIAEFREVLRYLPKLRNKSKSDRGTPIKDLIARTKADESIPRISSSTVNKHMKNCNALFRWAKQNGYISASPSEGVHRPGNRRRDVRLERNAWSVQQLRRWFESPFYQGCRSETRRQQPGSKVVKDHYYWIPLIGAFHPLRAEEIAQLDVSDIREQGGIAYFDIVGGLTTADIKLTGKQVKTTAAIRQVPIHSLLIDIGFAAYVEEVKTLGKRKLFPGLARGGTANRYSAYFLKRFREFIVKQGISGVSFHGLRHTVITELSNSYPHTDIIDHIDGHKFGGERYRYRKQMLPQMKEAIECINYPGIGVGLFKR